MNTSRIKSSSRGGAPHSRGDDTAVTNRFQRHVRWFYRLLVFYLAWLGFLLYVALH